MTPAASCSYLFDPRRVSSLLDGLPHLRAKLADPFVEGVPSTAYPLARFSEREVFRVLGNDHYGHLAALLGALDRCIGAGFEQPNLLRTRSWKTFSEGLAELHLAAQFLKMGLGIRGFDGDKANISVPDLLLTAAERRASIEVYSPQRWEHVGTYQNAIRDALKYLDVPFDFRCDIRHEPIDPFRDGGLLTFHPGALDQQLTRTIIRTAVQTILHAVREQLHASGTLHVTHDVDDLNLRTSVSLHAHTSTGDFPLRKLATSGPCFSGHAPEHDFRSVVRRAMKKLGHRQALAVRGATGCLAVDLSGCSFDDEFNHSYYREEFARALHSAFGDLAGHGLVAFFRRFSWDAPAELLWLSHSPDVHHDLVQIWGTPSLRV